MPPIGDTGAASTMILSRGYEALAHVESAQDAGLTTTSGLGTRHSNRRCYPGAGAFALPALNDGKGVVLQGGEGVYVAFDARRATHCQSAQLLEPRAPEPQPPASRSCKARTSTQISRVEDARSQRRLLADLRRRVPVLPAMGTRKQLVSACKPSRAVSEVLIYSQSDSPTQRRHRPRWRSRRRSLPVSQTQEECCSES